MSFFGLGGKDKYFMGYAASSLFDKSKNIIQEVALGSIINGGNYVEALSRDAYPNCMYAHLRHMYNYCEANYAFGLPNLTVQEKFLMQEDVVRNLVSQYMYTTLEPTDTIDVLYNALAAGMDSEYYAFKYALDNNILTGNQGVMTGAYNTPNVPPATPESVGNITYSNDINFTGLRYERTDGIDVNIVTAADGSHTYAASFTSSSPYGPPSISVPITPTNIPANDFVPSGKEFSANGDTYFFWDSDIPATEGTVTIRAFATHTPELWEHYSGKFHIHGFAINVTDIITTFNSRTDTVSSYNMKIVVDLDATIRLIQTVTSYGVGVTTTTTEVSSTIGKAPLVFAEWNQDITEFVTTYSASLIVRILDSNGNPKTGWLSATFNDSNSPTFIKQLVTSLSLQPFYPIFPLKRNWEYIDVDNPNPECLVDTPNPVNPTVYTGTVYKALNKMKINAKDLIKALKEDESGNEIIDSYIYFATDVLQDDPRLNVYFYKYFKWLIEIIPGAGMVGEHTFIVSDDTFKTSYKFRQISQVVSQGVVAKKGKATKTISDIGDITVKYQLTDSTYEEVTIYGLRMFNSIYAGKKDGVEVSVHNWAVDDERNHSPFLIPLSQTVLKQVNARTREIVLKYSAKLVCYTQHKEHVKWYQTGWFGNVIKIVMLIIAVILTYFTGGGGASFYAWASSLTASQIVSMVVITLLKSILIGLIIKAIMVNVLVPLFGAKLALVFTVAAMMYGMFGNTGFDLPFAADVSTLAGPALNVAVSAYSEEQMSEIQDAYEQFNAMVKDRQQELKDAAKELGYYNDSETTARIDPLGFGLNVDMSGYESPDMYLLRKSTNASLSLTGYEYVQTYYADKLSLL